MAKFHKELFYVQTLNLPPGPQSEQRCTPPTGSSSLGQKSWSTYTKKEQVAEFPAASVATVAMWYVPQVKACKIVVIKQP